MIQPGRTNINIAEQIALLRIRLRLPITDVVFGTPIDLPLPTIENPMPTEVAEVYIDNAMVGKLQFIMNDYKVCYITYGMEDCDWEAIYRKCQHIIFPAIMAQEPRAYSVAVSPNLWLNIQDVTSLVIKAALCDFANEKWNVRVCNPGELKQVVKTVTVTLPPPALM